MKKLKTRTRLIPRYNWDYGFRDFFKAVAGVFEKDGNGSRSFADLFGSEPVFTNAGRTSLYIMLRSLNLPEGADVGVPLFCCPVVFNAIKRAGLAPKFIDIEMSNYCISPQDLRKKVDGLKAVVVVHMFGNPADMDPILSICGNIPVIEDCAQSLFSRYKGVYTGLLSGYSFFSFRSGKYLSAGEGSAIFSKDAPFLEKIRKGVESFDRVGVFSEVLHSAAVYAKSTCYKRPWYGAIGYPLGTRIDRKLNLTAKTGFKAEQIRHSDLRTIGRRIPTFFQKVSVQRENAFYLLKRLENRNLLLPQERKDAWSNFSQFAIGFHNARERDWMAAYLFEQGIDTAKYGDEVINVAGQEYGYDRGCPNAEKASKTVLVVPNHYTLANRDLDHIAECINRGSRLMANGSEWQSN